MRGIRHHLASTIGADLSAGAISKISDAVRPGAIQRAARGPLEAFLPRDPPRARSAPMARADHQVSDRADHIAVGVDMDGVKHVLGIWVQVDEGPP